MKQYRLHGCVIGIVCAAIVLTVSIVAGPTLARYENKVIWSDVYAPGVNGISSNYLTQDGQTVLLQPWQAIAGTTRTQEILLFAGKGTVDAALSCSTESPYISATMETDNMQVTPSGYICQIRLTTTDAAEQITQKTQAKVTVTLAAQQLQETLFADFLITLLPNEQHGSQQTETAPQTELSVLQQQQDLAFAWEEKLLFSIDAGEHADTLELMYNGDSFPQGTCYSTDSEKWFVLGDPMTIKIPVAAATPVKIALDFSGTDVTPPQSVNFTAMAYLNETMTGQINFAAPVTREPLAINAPEITAVINGNETLTLPITGDSTGFSWQIQHLTQTDKGIAYTQTENLTVRMQEDGAKALVISNEAGTAKAGTYRLTLTRKDDGVIIATCYFDFFIHY